MQERYYLLYPFLPIKENSFLALAQDEHIIILIKLPHLKTTTGLNN